MDSTTIANDATRTAFGAMPAAPRRSAATWQRSHASTPVLTTGGVRLDAPAVRLRGGVEAYLLRGEGFFAATATRSTVPSSGTTTTSPPV
ncbi:hypothetical protein MO973_32230 [Paenibacillus sp. TRM 82003]|uniref:hypothetical protein n=1 Tax=Kineococcus sp. TRM81007 TaxID=2925831 RepID=UPI001F56639F|nr:hypothetical protein [Kineococcus sp. TRM81007]MCI2239207.1 hypothetical protein [Kineococcus sp. TRM81007]MCI3924886.1 hypothetical protein [Paenibacillus sp. TRM 82003]